MPRDLRKTNRVWQQDWPATKSCPVFEDRFIIIFEAIGFVGNFFVSQLGTVLVRNKFEVGYIFFVVGGVGPARMYLQQGRTTSPPKLQRR